MEQTTVSSADFHANHSMALPEKTFEEFYSSNNVRGRIYAGRYIVTENGSIFTMGIKGGSNIHRQVLRPNEHGYLRATINRQDEYVHRIVRNTCTENGPLPPPVRQAPGRKLAVEHKRRFPAFSSMLPLFFCLGRGIIKL